MGKEEADHSKGGGDEGDEKVPFYKLFSFADALDVVLMSVGTVAAIGSGLSLPLMTLIFGQMINSFGDSNRANVVHDVTKVCCCSGKLVFDLGIVALMCEMQGEED